MEDGNFSDIYFSEKGGGDRKGLIDEKKRKCYELSLSSSLVWVLIIVIIALSITTIALVTKSDNNSDAAAPITPSSNPNLAVAPFPACNFGPMHHTHLIIPLAANEFECAKDTSRFLLSHGATFFCPHTWDIKLLASIVEDEPRSILCNSYFNALNTSQSPMHAFRPTLQQGGLPAEAMGQLTSWDSPVIYWVYNFGGGPDGGPDFGWNLTTIYSETTTVQIDQVLYGRQFDLQPSPAALTYLVHAPLDGALIVLSHYISTGGDSGFDQILIVNMTRTDFQPLLLRPTWPLYLTIPTLRDVYMDRVTVANGTIDGLLSVYNSTTNLPMNVNVKVTVKLDYYYGREDGFADFTTICPPNGTPESPTMCLNGATD